MYYLQFRGDKVIHVFKDHHGNSAMTIGSVGLAFADVNGDGITDFVAASQQPRVEGFGVFVDFWLSNTDGTWVSDGDARESLAKEAEPTYSIAKALGFLKKYYAKRK